MDEKRLRRFQVLTLVAMTLMVIAVHMSAESAIMREVRRLLVGLTVTTAQSIHSLPGYEENIEQLGSPLDPSFTDFHASLTELLESERSAMAGTGDERSVIPRISRIRVLRYIPAIEGESERWSVVAVVGMGSEDAPSPGEHWVEEFSTPYPMLGLETPVAERHPLTDERGTWLVAHAPLRGSDCLVTVEMSREELRGTLLQVRLVSLGAWGALFCLVMIAFHFLKSRNRAFEAMSRLDRQLRKQNDKLIENNHALEGANSEFANQLRLAKRVQQNFLPATLPQSEKLAFGTVYLACEAVGGDIYDVFTIDEEHMGFYIADVSGHGISAALIGATLKMSIEAMKTAIGSQGTQRRASILYRPKDMIVRLHTILRENLPRDQFITMQYGTIDTETGMVRLCNAGHTWPVVWRSSTEKADLVEMPSGLPIGFVVPEMLQECEISLDRGDKMILYTDGLIESHGDNAEDMYGEDRLLHDAERFGTRGAVDLVDAIEKEVSDFVGDNPNPDDVAIIAVEMKASSRVLAEAN